MTFDAYTSNMDKNYQAYLIRFKRRAAQSSWCASLENVHTRETLTLVYLLESLSEKSRLPGVGATAKKEKNHENHQ